MVCGDCVLLKNEQDFAAQWLRRHRDIIADETAVQHLSGLRGKIPVPLYQHAAAVADNQTKMGAWSSSTVTLR